MKAAVFYGKEDLRILDVPVPEVGANDALIRVEACGVCGTDLHIFHGDPGAADVPVGTIIGHEFSGTVVKTGASVTSVKAGDRVCVDPNRYCGTCDMCRRGLVHFCRNMIGYGTTVNGGFAEYATVDERQLYKLDDSVSFGRGAMAEPLACCLNGINQLEIRHGSTVCVIGAGMIGLIMLQLAKSAGAARVFVIEPVEARRLQAEKLGADATFAPGAAEELKKTQIDYIIECAGRTETMVLALDIIGNRGKVMLFGLTAPDDEMKVKPFSLFKKEVTIMTSFINPCTQPAAVALINAGRLDLESMAAVKIPLSELPAVLADPVRRRAGKAVVFPQEGLE